MEDSRATVSEMFDQISPTYDRVNRILSFGQDKRWRKKVAHHLPLKPHLQVLDLATGTGDQIFALFDAGASIRKAIGIDLAEEMLKLAKRKNKKKNVEFLVGDAQSLSFAKESFDAVTFSFGIRNVVDPLLSLQEIYRVLKPNGKALILEFSHPSRWIRPFFFFYLRSILPLLGSLFSRHKGAYSYLNRTIETFAHGETFIQWMKEAGFSSATCHPMNFGSVSLYVGEKK